MTESMQPIHENQADVSMTKSLQLQSVDIPPTESMESLPVS